MEQTTRGTFAGVFVYLHCHRLSLDEPFSDQLVHVQLIVKLLLSDVMGKQTSSLIVETFN